MSFVPEDRLPSLSDRLLAIGAVGDVLAARRTARALLAGRGGEFADLSLAILTLASACVHVLDQSEGELHRSDLAAFLQEQRQAGALEPSLTRHASQFVRYAAAEFHAQAPSGRAELLDGLIALLATPEEAAASSRRSGGVKT